MKEYEALVSLADIANGNGNIYTVTDYAFGFIPFKNEENMVEKVGNDFFSIAHWLLVEAEENFKAVHGK